MLHPFENADNGDTKGVAKRIPSVATENQRHYFSETGAPVAFWVASVERNAAWDAGRIEYAVSRPV
jgi:hypothetical protein